jgi:kinetochore protein Spc25
MPPNRAARHRDVDVADLERELAEFRDIIDGWVGENVARERRLKDAHDRQILKLEREYDALINRERELSERAADNAREAERYEMEAEQALEETNAARELAEGLPEQLAALRERVREERTAIEHAKDKATGTSAMAKLDALRGASAMYAERLGLRFEYGEAERLRLVFKYVDARAPEREFTFAVRLRGTAYEVMECAPMLASIDALLAECNRSNDFGKFVRDARKAFVELANGDDGVGALASPRASAGRATRSNSRR